MRIVQGWVAGAAIECAQMAQAGLTGPRRMLTGIYGYAHLYGRDALDPDSVVAGLGREWRLLRMMFKKVPSCGATQGLTELVLGLVAELDLVPGDVGRVEIRLPPYSHKLVGHAWRLGDNPRVDAQFSARWCAANAIVRRSSRLEHFRPAQVADPAVLALLERIDCVADPALDARGHTAVDVVLTTTRGQAHRRGLDIAPGFPGRDLDDAQHLARWRDCMAYAPWPLAAGQAEGLLDDVARLEALADVRGLVGRAMAAGACQAEAASRGSA